MKIVIGSHHCCCEKGRQRSFFCLLRFWMLFSSRQLDSLAQIIQVLELYWKDG